MSIHCLTFPSFSWIWMTVGLASARAIEGGMHVGTALVWKNTPWQTKPHQKLLEHKMCLTIDICIVTKPHLGKVCIFLPILFKGELIHYICVIPILLCCYHTFHLGLNCLRGNWYIIYVSFQFYCVVTTHFTLDSNLNSNIHCSISKSNFQVS